MEKTTRRKESEKGEKNHRNHKTPEQWAEFNLRLLIMWKVPGNQINDKDIIVTVNIYCFYSMPEITWRVFVFCFNINQFGELNSKKNNYSAFKDGKTKAQEVQMTWHSHTAGEEVSLDRLQPTNLLGTQWICNKVPRKKEPRSPWWIPPYSSFIRTEKRGCLEAYISQENCNQGCLEKKQVSTPSRPGS